MTKKIILLIVALALAGGVWFYMQKSDTPSAPNTPDELTKEGGKNTKLTNQSQTTAKRNVTCDDSEDGIDYYTYGELTLCDFTTLEHAGDSSPIGCALHNDFCGSEPNILWEKYCEGDEFKFEKYICPKGCENGACIK